MLQYAVSDITFYRRAAAKPGQQAARAMKKTISQVINGKEYTILLDHSSIAVRTSTGLYPVMKLTRNKDYILKFNKTTISTCNAEMLAYVLESDIDMIIQVINHITRINVSNTKITRSQFYNVYFNNNLDALVSFFNNASHKTRQLVIRDHCCDDHNAKMSGMISYSTLVMFNRFCVARMKKDFAVCAHCFAARQLGIYVDQLKKLARAHVIATRCKWDVEDIPFIDCNVFPYFRLESFGDINNTLQVENYNTLAAALEKMGVSVTLWSKNPGIIQQAVNGGMVLSDNLTIGLSSLELNKPEIDKAKKYKFIKFVFTVYTPEYATENNITINCGGRHCLSCLNCYKTAKHADTLIIINELLK